MLFANEDSCSPPCVDTKHTAKACDLDNSTCKEPCPGTGLENQFQCFHKRDTGDGIVDLSSTDIRMLKYTNDHHSSLLDQIAATELHEAFRNISGHEPLVIDKNWPKKVDFYGFENYAELDSIKLMKVDATSNVNEGETTFSSLTEYSGSVTGPITRALNNETMSQNQLMKRKRIDGCESLKTSTSEVKVEICSAEEGDKAGLLVSPKRSRKPPRRYIEESLDYEPKSHNRKCSVGRKSKDRILHDRFEKHNWQKEFHVEEVVYEDDSFNGGCIQVPFGLPMEKEHPKKNKTSLVSIAFMRFFSELLCCSNFTKPLGNPDPKNQIFDEKPTALSDSMVVRQSFLCLVTRIGGIMISSKQSKGVKKNL